MLVKILPNAEVKNTCVDNITSTTNCDIKQNLDSLFSKLCFHYRIKYNIQKFPAIFIKYPVDKNCVTVFIFSSGKVICVGGKSEEQLKKTSNWLKNVVHTA